MNDATHDKKIAMVPLISVETALAQSGRAITWLIVALVISAGLQFMAWSVAFSAKTKGRGSDAANKN